jgi:hypothetical protein
MEQAVRKCLSLGDGEFTGVYASEWEPRFDNYIDEDETVSLVDSSLDNTRKCVLTAPLEDLMMLVDYGFLHRGVKTPERWFWGEHCYHGDKELGLILQSLRLSTLYSREFLAYAKRYLRFLRGRNSDNRRHAEALEPLYPGVLGQAGVDRLKEAVKAMNAVGDEFAFLFQKLPEIPYLFEAVAAGRNDNQRGGARSLAEFVGSLIGDRHTPGLHFSYLNDTKEEPK